jgi:hypothetical protein
METITLQVEQEIAQAYRDSDRQKQEKINSIIKLFLTPEFTEKSLSEVMEKIADQAEKRGLTPELLEEILNDEQ